MRIVLLEVGEEFGVSEFKQAGSIVGHAVGLSWDEEAQRAVAVKSLVGASFVA